MPERGNSHQTAASWVTSGKLNADPIEALKCFNDGTPRAQQWFHYRHQAQVVRNEFKDAVSKTTFCNSPNSKPEYLQRATDTVFNILRLSQ